MQNENHCLSIERKLNDEYLVRNIVLFASINDRRNLHSPSTYEIGQFIKYYEGLPDELYLEDLEDIYNILGQYQATEEELEAHREDIKRLHNNR